MPANPSHRLRRAEAEPTMEIAAVGERRGRHAAAGWLGGLSSVWLVVGTGLAAVILGIVFIAAVSGSDDSGSAIATATPADEVPLPVETMPDEILTPTPAATQSRSPQRAHDPAALLALLESTLDSLVSGHQLTRNSAKDLSKRLRQARAALSDGDQARTWAELTAFSDRLTELRQENRISSAAYQKLAAIITQLAQELPRR